MTFCFRVFPNFLELHLLVGPIESKSDFPFYLLGSVYSNTSGDFDILYYVFQDQDFY